MRSDWTAPADALLVAARRLSADPVGIVFAATPFRSGITIEDFQLGTQIYSPPLSEPASENETNKVFSFEFSFIPTRISYQPGLYVSVSPDNGTGHRMFRVDLIDAPISCGDSSSCVLIFAADSPSGADGYIDAHYLGRFDPSTPHTVKATMKFNPGEDNDLARVSVDGTRVSASRPGRTTTAPGSPKMWARTTATCSSAPPLRDLARRMRASCSTM